MMNWNQNDTKYILKRIILYFIIAGIVFFAGHSCAKAQISSVSTTGTSYYSGNLWFTNIQGQGFRALGNGYIIGTIWVNPNGGYNYGLKQIIARTYEIVGNTTNTYTVVCELGNQTGYVDNTKEFYLYSFKCPVAFGQNAYLGRIESTMIAHGQEEIYSSEIVTFVGDNSSANAIINANNQAIQNQINSGNANAQAIQNAINQSTTNTVNAINNQTTAINNQTQAINDQTDWFDQDYSSIIDTEFLDVFDDLFDNDDDIVRQFILIPLNFFVLIYNACSSNSCSPIELGELYGTTLTIPCINWSSLVGTAVTNTIDIIFSGCLVFGMIRMIKKMINKIMTLSSTITDECGVEVFK